MQTDIKYLKGTAKPHLFLAGRPERFEILTTVNKCRLYGQLMQMDKYSIFVGSAVAQSALQKLKGNIGLDLFTSADLRQAGEIFIELSDVIDRKLVNHF